MLKEERVEEIGEMAETADNLVAASKLPIDDKIHVEQLRNGLAEISQKLKTIYVEATGENPWQ